MEAPSTDDNQTVKSAPQATVFTSETRHRTGDSSNSSDNKALLLLRAEQNIYTYTYIERERSSKSHRTIISYF